MNPDILADVAKLSDPELLAKIPILARHEREAMAALVAHLAIFDERQLYLGEGCSSLFTYCTQVLHYAEYAAYNRIEAARAARKYPIVLKMLADGSVHLAAVRLLAPELTSANHRSLLEAATHKTKRQVEELVAGLRPQPPVPTIIRRVPALGRPPARAEMTDAGTAAASPGALEPGGRGSGSLPSSSAPAPVPTAPLAASSPSRPAVIAPLAPERYRVQFTASAETCAKLRLARDLLLHQIPDGDIGQIIDRALTALLREVAKQKVAAIDGPRGNHKHHGDGSLDRGSRDNGTRGSTPGSRHIPAEVRRAVWLRDSGQCAFLARNGRRCTERGLLEFHHVVPYAVGGEPTVANIQLRCRSHNGYEAQLFLGTLLPGSHVG